jgi:two-component system response regulator GlrR
VTETGTWVKRRPDGDSLHVRACRLEVVSGPDRGLVKVFRAPSIVIGRANADLKLTDRRVSALHAEIRLEPTGYRLRDLGSTNGTFVSGMRVVEGFLVANTILAIGDNTIRFEPLAESVELPISIARRFGGFVGESPVMRRVFEVIQRLAATDATVLISGETGTGKELAAQAIHHGSARSAGPFIILDCGAIPAQLVEDQLFGHEAGAFTNAIASRPGVFEAAHGGTLFLDEIGELPLDVQPKLLRAVETRQVRRIGSVTPINCDVRLVAATNRDLAAQVNSDAFRADLYFRIAVARIHLPPLRERREDIAPLVEHLAQRISGGTLPAGFVEWAERQPWPGNVRELRGSIEQAITLSKFPEMERQWSSPTSLDVDVTVPFKEAKKKIVDELERRYITELIDAHDGNISAAARAADVDRMTIYKMMNRAGLRGRSQE